MVSPEALKLRGGHNALNAAAAVAAVRALGIDDEIIADVLGAFEGLPHRMALVGEIQGVCFYDDSKGTNVGASVTALTTLVEDKAVLIAGGRDKGGSYAPLVEALRKKGRSLVVIGEASDRIASAAEGVLPIERATSMDDAVVLAWRAARPGDAVLLSPACSSFDMFEDYKDRGDAFVRAVGRVKT
jgi:UDP-N-acetylmuramoylalanine--D-glutamate ligase